MMLNLYQQLLTHRVKESFSVKFLYLNARTLIKNKINQNIHNNVEIFRSKNYYEKSIIFILSMLSKERNFENICKVHSHHCTIFINI